MKKKNADALDASNFEHEPQDSAQEITQPETSWYAAENADADGSLRPAALSQFCGQEQLKKNLSVYIQAARTRGDALDHVFLSGSHGLGKTSLAYIIARELGVAIKTTSAPVIEKPKDLIGILTTLSENSVLFIDEIHRLRPVVEEILYSAMEDSTVDWIVGAGVDARTVRIPIARFTLVGATTQPGKVSPPLHSRFAIRERLDLYSEDDLARIIERSAGILGVSITFDAARMIGAMSRGTPRYANALLRRMRDFAQVQAPNTSIAPSTSITEETVRLSAAELGIDHNGLERIDRAILRALGFHYAGSPVGLKTLAIAVNESPESLEDFWEVQLIRQGFIKRTPQGRQITARGMEMLPEDERAAGRNFANGQQQL